METYEEKELKLEFLRARNKFEENLPHIYGFKLYKWAKEFIDSTKKVNILCSGNQVSKSSTQIRKCITWATDQSLWPKLWAGKPRQFWYLYPSSYGTEVEFQTKWKPEFLPKEEMKDHPIYGWESFNKNGVVQHIVFKSGVILYFKTYSQSREDLQGASVAAIFCFTAGHKVITSTGRKNIEDIRVGDYVLGKSGKWNSVDRVLSRKAETMVVDLSNGKSIEATAEHPFYVKNFGWKKFKDLTIEDTLVELSTWKNLKLLSSMVKHTIATQIAQISELETTGKLVGIAKTGCSMLICGLLKIKRLFQMVRLFATRILILLITLLKISSVLPRQSIQGFIKKMSGQIKRRGPITGIMFASGAKPTLSLGHLSQQYQGIVRRNAEGVEWVLIKTVRSVALLLGKRLMRSSFFAARSVLTKIKPGLELRKHASIVKSIFGRIRVVLVKNIVVCRAPSPTGTSKEVYNLGVSGDNTFYVADIITHNCDEEPPIELVDELMCRLIATDGYFHAVFTPTIGQEFWREAVEETGKNRRFKDSFRKQISMYDCLEYADGTPTMWNEKKIDLIKAGCKSEAEIQRRVYGRFVLDSGLKYPSFSRSKNVIDRVPVPKDWRVFVGVDCGSGGDNHPSAVVFIAASPNYDKGYIFNGRRFDGMVTTNSDLVQLVDTMCKEYNVEPDAIFYDYSAADLAVIAARMGKNYIPAEKSHAIGEQVINVLFKNNMLSGFRDENLDSLYLELMSLKSETPKRHAVDDYCDSLRYAVSKIPWDWSVINATTVVKTREETEADQRRGKFITYEEAPHDASEEISEWNELYGS